jgi:hypothetical protein
VLDSLDLKLDRHGWEGQSRYTKSGPEGPVAGRALLECFDQVCPLRIDVELIAAKKVDLCQKG